MATIGLTYNHRKPLRSNILRLNAKIRSFHPLGGFLSSLPQHDLQYLFKYFDIKGERVTARNLSNKIFGLSPKSPILTAISALKTKDSSCHPKKVLKQVSFTAAPFKGLGLENPSTMCYINAAINGLANCDMVRPILNSPELTDAPIFFQELIAELQPASEALKDPSVMRDAVHSILTSLSEIVQKKTKSATTLRTKFSKVFPRYMVGQHDSTEFITHLTRLNSSLADLFKFTLEEKKICRVCKNEEKIGAENNTDIRTQHCLNIMPKPHRTDIQNLVSSQLENESRVGENKMACSHCKTRQDTDVIKRVGTPPYVLAVRVRRDAVRMGHHYAPIVPVTPNETIEFQNTKYKIKSIIRHIADPFALQNPEQLNPLESGHYIAYLRQNSKWIDCNDEKVSEFPFNPETGLLYIYEKIDEEAPVEFLPQPDFHMPEQAEIQMPDQPEIQRPEEPWILVTRRRPKRKTKADMPPSKTVLMERKGDQNTPYPKRVHRKKKPVPLDVSADTSSTSDEENITSEEQIRKRKVYHGNKKIRQNMKKLKWSEPCKICQESWPGMELRPRLKICDRCANEKNNTRETEFPTFSLENDMIPSEPPEELKCLNPVEQCAIKMICPMMHFYKRPSGSHGSRGNVIAFEQEIDTFAENLIQLPRPPEELPIVILQSKGSKGTVNFKVNRKRILDALKKLIEICPPYKKYVTIDFENLAKYPESYNENMQGIRVVNLDASENDAQRVMVTMLSDNKPSESGKKDYHNPDEIFDIEAEQIEDALMSDGGGLELEDGGLPHPMTTKRTEKQRAQVDEMIGQVAKGIRVGPKKKSDEVPVVKCPSKGTEPVSEFEKQYMTRAWPHLFPDGKGDISNVRPGKTPKLSKYMQHLFKLNRRFAADQTFALVMCNQLQKHQAISTGNVYAKRMLQDMTVGELKKKIQEEDKHTLMGLLYFGSSIKGSPQFFSTEQTKAYQMIRHLRVESNDTEVMNMFLTFSAADCQWDHMHTLFEGSERYLNRKVVKTMGEIPEDADPSEYILERDDYKWRMEAVQKNADICSFYFRYQLEQLFEHILKPIYGVKEYFIRYEFQFRGSIHAHMVVLMGNGPTAKDLRHSNMKEGYPKTEKAPVSDDDYTETTYEEENGKLKEINTRMKRTYSEATLNARENMIRFAIEQAGISAVHPNPDPHQWPAPHGQNVSKPKVNIMRDQFNIPKDDKERDEKLEKIINRVMLHNCKKVTAQLMTHKKSKRIKRKRTRSPRKTYISAVLDSP